MSVLRKTNFGKKISSDASESFKQEGLVFYFDSKNVNSYNPNTANRWTDLITGNHLISNAAVKYDIDEGALNFSNVGEYLTIGTANPFTIPPGDFSFGFYGKIMQFFSIAGGIFRSASNSRGPDNWFFYEDNKRGFFRVENNSFMGNTGSEYAVLNENHYYSLAFYSDANDPFYRTGATYFYRDGIPFWISDNNNEDADILGHTGSNANGIDIYNFNYQFATNQNLGQYLKNLHAYDHFLTGEEMLANFNHLNSIHG